MVFDTILKAFWILLLVAFAFFQGMDYLMKYKNRKAGERYCELNGLIFLSAKSYELHTRLYFEKDGIKSWVNYKTDKNYTISWIKESPIEKLEKKQKTG